MWGGYKISKKMKEDLADVVNLLDKAKDSLITDNNTKHTQVYLKRATEICKKYID
ncbi:hypothetical protein PQ689_03225 [Thermoanaerobacterium thermosaccharolyticum]|uniref:hypothetical protein n=1 Tax=Thermoanaerobacterium thermosaccharolyticum TaxID=1517 RepID=UPI003D2B0856